MWVCCVLSTQPGLFWTLMCLLQVSLWHFSWRSESCGSAPSSSPPSCFTLALFLSRYEQKLCHCRYRYTSHFYAFLLRAAKPSVFITNLISAGAQQQAGVVAFPPAVPPRPLATQVHVITARAHFLYNPLQILMKCKLYFKCDDAIINFNQPMW